MRFRPIPRTPLPPGLSRWLVSNGLVGRLVLGVLVVWGGLGCCGSGGVWGWRLAGAGLGGSGGVGFKGPSGGLGVQPERREACEVVGCGEEVEVGVDFGSASHAGSAASVPAAFEVGEAAFDYGPGGVVVGLPGGGSLAVAGVGEDSFVFADADGSAAFGRGAQLALVALGARRGEAGGVVAVAAAADLDADPGGACDCTGVQIDAEAVLAVEPAEPCGALGSAPRVDRRVAQQLLELAAAVGAVAIHRRATLEHIHDPAVGGVGAVGAVGGVGGGGGVGVEEVINECWGGWRRLRRCRR